ncbi:hypothetical protein [Candidatus Poriferisocius sp.]|uniref:restriction system modified-DNA reader domain-containing protein n=1 Tax=Candidatus Poriferisocius sp. TaxID=3101276 RepID=UPI003B52D051
MSGVTVKQEPDGTSLEFDSGGITVSVRLTPKQVDQLVTKLVGRSEGEVGRLVDSGRVLKQTERTRAATNKGIAAVLPLLDAGMLRAGETLTMRSEGEEHSAVVRGDGSFDIDGHVEGSPTEAATYAAQAPRSGWRIWKNAAGETLEELRWRLRASDFRDTGGEASKTVEEWVDFCIRKRLKPNNDRPGTVAAFFSDTGVEDTGNARAVLDQWFRWCINQKWTRAVGRA